MIQFEYCHPILYSKTGKKYTKFINERYQYLGPCANGQFSKIKLVKDIHSGNKLAIKKYSVRLLKKKVTPLKLKDGTIHYKTPVDDIHREIKSLLLLSSPHCLRLQAVLTDPSEWKVYLLTNYYEKGPILKWDPNSKKFIDHHKLKLEVIYCIMKDCLIALQHLKEKRIVHRDIKPQNILLNSAFRVGLADFGCAEVLEPPFLLRGSSGTYHFMSPECLDCKEEAGYNGFASDLWSLGVVFFALLTKRLPFYSDNIVSLIDQIIEKKVDCEGLEEGPRQLIEQMLQKSSSKRATVQDCLLHPLFKH